MVLRSTNMTADSGYMTMSSAYCSTEQTSRSLDIIPSPRTQHNVKTSSVCKHALLKKIKTNKTKFFVLHKTSSSAPARLEYYDSESQWHKQKKPKRTIYLQACFSITPNTDVPNMKYSLTLYTKEDSFQIGFPTEQERDMWHADIQFLSRANYDLPREPVQNEWQVKVSAVNMSSLVCGECCLSLDRRGATLYKEAGNAGALSFPLDSITRTDHNDKYFIMEVNDLAPTGPGEMWMEVEDSLIAKNVHSGFTQNISVAREEDPFRPTSKSLSCRDRSEFSGRIRSGSDAKLRSRTEQSLVSMGQRNSYLMSSNVSISHLHRERSDSIDSHGTNVSMSTDESEQYRPDRNCASRSVTPDLRADSRGQDSRSTRKGADNYRGLIHSATVDNTYFDMSYNSNSHDDNSNFVYIDMVAAGAQTQHANLMPSNRYIDMTCGRRSPSFLKGYRPKPDVVKSYLIEDDESPLPERRHNSVGSRAQVSRIQRDTEYVEMCRNPLAAKEKCSSAPHLNPMTISHKSLTVNDPRNITELPSFPQTGSASNHSHRPRGSSWSQGLRPYAADKQGQAKRSHRSQQGKIQGPDYIDMTCGLRNHSSYVEMSLNHKNQSASSKSTKEDKENRMPRSHPSRSQIVSEPFPELSASSEDDVSLHSMEGSVSLHSLTSSGDSVSMTSHSPQLMVSSNSNPSMESTSSSVRISPRTLQLPSFIRDDYMEMSPGACK